MVDLVDQPSGNGATAAAAQWWSAEQCPDDAQGQGGPTDRPDQHQTKPYQTQALLAFLTILLSQHSGTSNIFNTSGTSFDVGS